MTIGEHLLEYCSKIIEHLGMEASRVDPVGGDDMVQVGQSLVSGVRLPKTTFSPAGGNKAWKFAPEVRHECRNVWLQQGFIHGGNSMHQSYILFSLLLLCV
jgi:hypothetical protein